MGSEDYATSNPNAGSDDGSTLAARRARLRGSLAKQAAPTDPYQAADPYAGAGAATSATPSAQESTSSAGSTASPAVTVSPGITVPPNPISGAEAPFFDTKGNGNGFQSIADQTAAAASTASPASPAVAEDPTLFSGASTGNGGGQKPTLSSALFFASANSPAPSPSNPNPLDNQTSYFSAPEVESLPQPEPEPAPQPPTARSDRRRGGSSSAATMPTPEPVQEQAPVFEDAAPIAQPAQEPAPYQASPSLFQESAPYQPASAQEPAPSQDFASLLHSATYQESAPYQESVSYQDLASVQDAQPPLPPQPVSMDIPAPPNSVANLNASLTAPPSGYVYGIQPDMTPPDSTQLPVLVQSQAIEIMNNMDQAMSACAMNLSELQKIATEQTDALKGVAESLQNQSFFEIGLNLNSLMESLSAALEPMKAVGELVPAIDQLVAVMESRESSEGGEQPAKLSREQLITNLAEQLSAGQIDPWTFKCAYMAVFPAEHPADLLHRLVDLLGTQRLSGDLFRSAYDAVQAPDPPPRSFGSASSVSEDGETRTVVRTVTDEAMISQLEDLKRTNEEFLRRNEDIEKRLQQKDAEFGQVLATKESELQEAQELLNSRWEEFNTRYDELTETLHKRDEVLQEREAELVKKESENLQLRTQMEELRDQTKDMVADLQRQLSAKPKEEPPKQPGFFDSAPTSAQQPQQQPAQQAGLFDAGPAKPLFGATDAQAQQNSNPLEQLQPSAPQPAPAAPQAPAQPPVPSQTNPALAQPMSSQQQQSASAQAVPRPAAPTTPFVSGAGSYGSGVRAQVFEVIVRQALAGAPWREICAGPMQVNNISPEEVEAEVKRRQALLKK